MIEAALLFASIGLYLRAHPRGKRSLIAFVLIMLGIQASTLCGAPSSERVTAIMALTAYLVFAAVMAWWERANGALRLASQ